MSEPGIVARLTEERRRFHAELLASNVLHFRDNGNANVSDGGNRTSVALGDGFLRALEARVWPERIAPQTGGYEFEKVVEAFVLRALKVLDIFGGREFSTRRRKDITDYHQYRPIAPETLTELEFDALRHAFGGDYVVTPDILVERRALSREELNARGFVVDGVFGELAALRAAKGLILHASISCKQTIRSDRSQNSRLEALNLLRMRTGRAPHIVVVTSEPLPSRIGSIAIGTGDLDCTYHVALPELLETMATHLKACEGQPGQKARKKQESDLKMMVKNGRLKDIADLPLDLLL